MKTAVVILMTLGLMAVSAQQSCTYQTVGTKGETLSFDLSPMTLANGNNYMIKDSMGSTFYANICGNATAGCSPAQAVCQKGSNSYFYGCGDLSTQKFADGESGPYSGVTVLYSEGDFCGSISRSTTIYIACSLSTEGEIYAAEEPGSCTYTLWMKSKYACPL
ncbi:hypothetical protein Pelo_14448 [Pelomyxa schiedti]|nr:hypothetical protein Pelo_14448 [Pelomyxa schiedti]